jgi:23S rRNA (uracil1939-C5)-methyltransferase
VQVGDQIELTLENLALGGEAVARTDEGMVVFVRGGIPGDRGIVELTKRKPSFATGKLVKLLHPSSLRTAARCEYFGQCGGCKWQYLPYAEQLRFKQQHVAEALQRIGKISDVDVKPILGMDPPWFYRNKMEFTFSRDAADRVILGQHVAGRWDQVVDLHQCYLQSETSVAIFDLCRQFARTHNLSVFSGLTTEGLLRHVAVREGKQTSELMVNLVTSGEYFPQLDRFVRYLLVGCPHISSMVLTINRRSGKTSQGQEEHLLFGAPTIHETVNGLTFEISSQSFFQTNTLQAERLYQIVQRMAETRPHGTAVDLYCGAGAIALHLAPQYEMVHGIELVESAVRDAERNADNNGVDNVSFSCGAVQKILPDVLPAAPDLIVVDPPRAGLSKKTVRHILSAAPRQVLYVSCNPATLARDLALLRKGGFRIAEVQPVDMFPHTYHIETIVHLRQSDGIS